MTTRTSSQLLNLGCGRRFHPDWINIDLVSAGPGVIAHDLSRGIPLNDASVDVVYHAAMLEHLRPADARQLMRECFRVLRPGGLIRVGVPNSELICRLYLEKLDALEAGDGRAEADYDWMVIELLDQSVREQAGGRMVEFLRQQPLPNKEFVLARIGEEGRDMLEQLDATAASPSNRYRRPWSELVRRGPGWLGRRARRGLLRILLGRRLFRALTIGQLRLSGEVHQWLYDRFSLRRLLVSVGFDDVQRATASTSRIPDWTEYHLDTLPDGTVLKPDLFFMEAVKGSDLTP